VMAGRCSRNRFFFLDLPILLALVTTMTNQPVGPRIGGLCAK
jgi:hypothetical protein